MDGWMSAREGLVFFYENSFILRFEADQSIHTSKLKTDFAQTYMHDCFCRPPMLTVCVCVCE